MSKLVLAVKKVDIDQATAVRGLRPNLEQLAYKAGAAVQRRATQLVPVDTGRLKSSIHVEIERSGGTPIAYVGSEVEYAIFVEAGTRRMAARPYLLPALDAVRGSIR